MLVCKDIKQFSRTHETIADLFSLLAVALLFASMWATLEYHRPVLDWLSGNYLIRGPLLMLGLMMNGFAILALLAVGSARFGEADERCFGTFRGRRAQHGAKGMFSAWMGHVDHIGRKHR
jgi:hypothetical protein